MDIAGTVAVHVLLSFDPPDDKPAEGWTSWLQGEIPPLRCFPHIQARRLFAEALVRIYQTLRILALDRDHDPPYEERLRERPLVRYLALDCPNETDLERLKDVLLASGKVEIVYPESGTLLPRCGPAKLPWICSEGHLEAAPEGIDASYAWHFPGGDGAGLRLVDVEKGWDLLNTDLLDAAPALSSGSNLDEREIQYHGTAVLGILAAARNPVGTNGIAPAVSSLRVVSVLRDSGIRNIPDAILAAVSELRFGDVLLLEIQASYEVEASYDELPFRPVEVESAVFEVIRFATALGIVVVEPAGNGSSDLDRIPPNHDPQWPMFDRRDLEHFQDSGAILVGASYRPFSPEPYGRWNYGSRVDCYAWGDCIWTLRTLNKLSPKARQSWLTIRQYDRYFLDLLERGELFQEDPPRLMTPYGGVFKDTSAATAVIAGAALSVQGMAQAVLGYRFSPWQLRLILSDPANGTPPQVPQKGNIGVMPDLKKIIRQVLNIPADVYPRDCLGDTGEEPRRPRMESPDLLVLAEPLRNPQEAYGEGSGREDDDLTGTRGNVNVEEGDTCYVGLRVRNRGGREAERVLARIFFAPASTLLVPSLWQRNEVAAVMLSSVPEADQLTVSDLIAWQVSALPEVQSTDPFRAWIAIVNHTEDDPGPNLDEFNDWSCFLKTLQADNNFACRNLHSVQHVTGVEESNPDAWVKLPFLVAGAPDCKRVMRIEVLSRLPRVCKVWIDMPRDFCDLRQISSVFCPFPSDLDRVRLPVNPNGKHYFREVPLAPDWTSRLFLLVHVPPLLRRHSYRLAVRQIWENQEVGRLTWRLIPRA